MGEIINTFHLDIKLIIAQLVNFVIVLAVLYKFAYRPILQIMNDRTKTIENSLDNAKKIEQRLTETEEEAKTIVREAKQESAAIMERANQAGEQRRQEMINKAKEEIGQIINQERERIQVEKGEAMKEIKKEVAIMVSLSLEKLIGKKVDGKEDQAIIADVVKK
ncbi:MAG: F0F1 ATP synthase subunit B [Candidatus Falkowbacteria bacterium]